MKWLKKALGLGSAKGRTAAEEHVTRGYIAAHEGRLDAAQHHYADAIDADDTLAVAFFNGGQTELERYNRDAAALDDAGRAQRLAAAASLLERGLTLEPQHAPSWRTLARVRERQRAYAAAVVAWQNALRTLAASSSEPERPGSPAPGPAIPELEAHGVVAAGAARTNPPGSFDEARKELARLAPFADLETALTTARASLAVPGVGGATATGAAGHEGDDDVVDARAAALDTLLATWERVRLAGVDEPPRMFTLAGALARAAGRSEQARSLLEQAAQRDKHDLEAHKGLATLCLAQGDLTAALSSSMAAYRGDPVDAGLVCNVGVCHLALGDLEKAAEFISLATSMAERDPIVTRAVAALKDAQRKKANQGSQ